MAQTGHTQSFGDVGSMSGLPETGQASAKASAVIFRATVRSSLLRIGDSIMDRNVKSVAFALILLWSSTVARAGDSLLIGTWKLKSFVREIVGTGERYNQLGEHPHGFLGYSSDGRMYAILVTDDRIKPREEAPTDEERVKLHKSMIAYAGTYTVDGGKVIHHVDISWNGARTGTDQVRFYNLEGAL
jgi:hypothetical protein